MRYYCSVLIMVVAVKGCRYLVLIRHADDDSDPSSMRLSVLYYFHHEFEESSTINASINWVAVCNMTFQYIRRWSTLSVTVVTFTEQLAVSSPIMRTADYFWRMLTFNIRCATQDCSMWSPTMRIQALLCYFWRRGESTTVSVAYYGSDSELAAAGSNATDAIAS
jgi:hypothetical protein